MKIAVLSDTHMPANSHVLPQKLLDALKGVDLILHAGDFTEEFVLSGLAKIAPVECVAGNMDSNSIRRKYPDKKILNLGNFKIGIIHGCGAPGNLINYAKEAFKEEALDCIVYGHSHIPSIDYIDNILYICPGSPTDKVFAPYNSFGMLEIDEKIHPEIIRL
jgi:uncharacterized protein